MKKVKIMLLSLALFAVVGGALAFKAKFGPTPWCTTDAYFDNIQHTYYCSFQFIDAGQLKTTTTQCPAETVGITPTDVGEFKVCTTTPDPITGGCPKTCNTLTSALDD
jgi:hypothetical protein